MPKQRTFTGEDDLKFLYTRFANGTLESIIHEAGDLVHRVLARLARNSWGEGKLYAVIPDTNQPDKRRWRPMLWKDLAEELGVDKFAMSRAASWLKERDIVRTEDIGAHGGERIYLNPEPNARLRQPEPGPDAELPDYEWARLHAPALHDQFLAVDEKYKTVALPIITERLEVARLIKQAREAHCEMAATTVVNGNNQNGAMAATDRPAMPATPLIRSSEPLEPSRKIRAAAADLTVIEQALSRHCVPDAAAVKKIWRDCLKEAPDCSQAEVAEVIDYKARRMGNVTSPVAVLLTHVPLMMRAAVARIRRGHEQTAPRSSEQYTPMTAEEAAELEGKVKKAGSS